MRTGDRSGGMMPWKSRKYSTKYRACCGKQAFFLWFCPSAAVYNVENRVKSGENFYQPGRECAYLSNGKKWAPWLFGIKIALRGGGGREKVCCCLRRGKYFRKLGLYGSPPGRSFYSCKRNQNTLGALPQDPDAPERPPGTAAPSRIVG